MHRGQGEPRGHRENKAEEATHAEDGTTYVISPNHNHVGKNKCREKVS